MLLEIEGETRWVEMATRCLKLMGSDLTSADPSGPYVTISTDGPWKAPKGFPRRELVSVGANGSHNFIVPAERLLDWLHANGLVTIKRKEDTPDV